MKKQVYFAKDLRYGVRKAATAILIAGITFFMNPVSAQNSLSSFEDQTKIEIIVSQENSPIELADGIILSSKVEMVDPSLLAFENLEKFLVSATCQIEEKGYSISSDAETGILNLTYNLPDGAILSINKSIKTMNDSLVAFNIFMGKKLILSDVMDVKKLGKYINTVQQRLKA